MCLPTTYPMTCYHKLFIFKRKYWLDKDKEKSNPLPPPHVPPLPHPFPQLYVIPTLSSTPAQHLLPLTSCNPCTSQPSLSEVIKYTAQKVKYTIKYTPTKIFRFNLLI